MPSKNITLAQQPDPSDVRRGAMTLSARVHVLLILLVCLGGSGRLGSAEAAGPKPEEEEEWKQLVVMIQTDLGGVVGAGILIGQDQRRWYIATATHLFRKGAQEARSIAVQFRWLQTPVLARLARAAPSPYDLAVLTVERSPAIDAGASRLSLDRLGSPEGVSRGDAVFALGQPNGRKWGISAGADRISRYEANTLYYESSSIAPGYSGGALLNNRGELLGMIINDTGSEGEALGITKLVSMVREWNYPVAASLKRERRATLTAGANFTCAVNRSFAIYCWGENRVGNLGDGSTASSIRPVRVATGARFVSVSAGYDHACGLTTTGAAFCWGDNEGGELGDGGGGPFARSPIPVAVAGQLRFFSISAGFDHSCGVTVQGAAYCWGSNEHGQLGDGSKRNTTVPSLVRAGLQFRSVSAGTVFSCGVTTDGKAYCWGTGAHGRLGVSSTSDSDSPVAVGGGLAFESVSAGTTHACGLSGDGRVHCWGDNSEGQLGHETPVSSSQPVLVSSALRFRSVSVGRMYTCGVTTSAQTYCWGSDPIGFVDAKTPTRMFPQQALTSVSAGMAHACGIGPDDAVYCVGNKLGNGTDSERVTPTVIQLPD
jgi:alpha-tubulin suppressor-like RCC1 family protein